MPKYKCPFPACEYETGDVADALAAVLISVHSTGTHTTTPTAPTASNPTAKIEKVIAAQQFPAQDRAKNGLTSSHAGMITLRQPKSTAIRQSHSATRVLRRTAS